tara:strand:+ start:965 stop:1156 length:192 start_codon:yes stop_codon:yes gene_type:complete
MMDPLFEALQALNEAAYAASKAGRDTTRYPNLNRHMLRQIMRMTDSLVDAGTGTTATNPLEPA